LTLVDANGRVQDYRILSDSADARRLRPQPNNIMIFTTFQPATTFGVRPRAAPCSPSQRSMSAGSRYSLVAGSS